MASIIHGLLLTLQAVARVYLKTTGKCVPVAVHMNRNVRMLAENKLIITNKYF